MGDVSKEELQSDVVHVETDTFDTLIVGHGLPVRHEKAVKCSCNQPATGNQLTGCVNCWGSGYIFLDPCETTAFIMGINYKPQYMQWTEHNAGTAELTMQYKDSQRLGWFDRIVLTEAETTFTENVYAEEKTRNGTDQMSALLTYPPISEDCIEHAFLWQGQRNPHLVLTPGTDFTIEHDRVLKLSSSLRGQINSDPQMKFGQVGIRYRHRPRFLVMDLQKDVRNVRVPEGRDQRLDGDRSTEDGLMTVRMPIQATLKREHYVMSDQGYNN